ncbi:MAG: chemotaxis protein CheA, partial [Elusimicrobiota bacterium]
MRRNPPYWAALLLAAAPLSAQVVGETVVAAPVLSVAPAAPTALAPLALTLAPELSPSAILNAPAAVLPAPAAAAAPAA